MADHAQSFNGQFSLRLNLDQKTILDRLALKSGLARAEILRRLLAREGQRRA